MSPNQQRIFELGLKRALDQIELFPEAARMSFLSKGRPDLRDLIFAGGYRMTYVIPEPEDILILSLIPPGSGQALD
jgi:hypothetical protein